MSADILPPFVRHLRNPASYPHPAAEIRLVQTHISYVLLAGDFVYKFKKPVDFGFLDFTTLARRRHFCGEELRLNRRLCPTVYLGLVRVAEKEGGLHLEEGGEESAGVIEYGVKMRRMPEEGMMGEVIRRGELSREMLDRIVEVLIPFYETAAGDEAVREFGRAQAVAVNVLENFEQTEGFVGGPALGPAQFEKITGYARKFLTRKELFDARIAAGRVRDCHGDLYSANICLDNDQVHVFDCIEFNERFRRCDVASDVAFLAMDLDFHGLAGLSDHFIERFATRSGDQTLDTVLNFYKCYRAYVRGKIGLFTASAPEVDEATRARCQEQAARYFQLAERYAGS